MCVPTRVTDRSELLLLHRPASRLPGLLFGAGCHKIHVRMQSHLGLSMANASKYLFGKYNYPNNLCPHGIPRGSWDLAGFLTKQWGTTKSWVRNDMIAKEIPLAAVPNTMFTFMFPTLFNKTGILAFYKLREPDGTVWSGQGHIDLWNKTDIVGDAYWDSQEIRFYQID